MRTTGILRPTRHVRWAGAAALTMGLLAGCASTVTGSPVAGGGPVAGPSTATGQTTATGAPEPATAGGPGDSPATPESVATSPGSSVPATGTSATVPSAESLPPVPTAVTIAPETATGGSADGSSGASPGSSVADGPGVPPAESSILRKDIGQDAGITSGDDQKLVFSFRVVEIDPAFGPRCNGTDVSANGNLIGVKIEFEVLEDYDPVADIPLGFQSTWFGTRAADGATYDKLGTDEAQACLTKSLLPEGNLAKGDSGTGWIVLDSPVRHGTVTFTQTDLDGGWEWVIPGS